MKIRIEITEQELRVLIVEHLTAALGFAPAEKDVKIEVKSKANYKSEWEPASFRAVFMSYDQQPT